MYSGISPCWMLFVVSLWFGGFVVSWVSVVCWVGSLVLGIVYLASIAGICCFVALVGSSVLVAC